MGFRRTETAPSALMVSGGGPGKRVAIWRVDPGSFLARHGFELRPDLSLRLVSRDPKLNRIAPMVIGATDTPKPVTAVYRGKTEAIQYAIEVVDRKGQVLEVYEQDVPVRKQKLKRELVGAITGWHRSMLVSRVFDWAYAGGGTEAQAIAFAVDMGVLVPGTAALAVPVRERSLLSAASRRTYDHDGVPLAPSVARRTTSRRRRGPSTSGFGPPSRGLRRLATRTCCADLGAKGSGSGSGSAPAPAPAPARLRLRLRTIDRLARKLEQFHQRHLEAGHGVGPGPCVSAEHLHAATRPDLDRPLRGIDNPDLFRRRAPGGAAS